MLYPERQPAPETLPDRLIGAAGFAVHRLLLRRLRGGAALEQQVARRSAELRNQPLVPLLAALRYRLRSEGMRRAPLREAFALYCAALPEGQAAPGADVLAAAGWLARVTEWSRSALPPSRVRCTRRRCTCSHRASALRRRSLPRSGRRLTALGCMRRA